MRGIIRAVGLGLTGVGAAGGIDGANSTMSCRGDRCSRARGRLTERQALQPATKSSMGSSQRTRQSSRCAVARTATDMAEVLPGLRASSRRPVVRRGWSRATMPFGSPTAMRRRLTNTNCSNGARSALSRVVMISHCLPA